MKAIDNNESALVQVLQSQSQETTIKNPSKSHLPFLLKYKTAL